MSRRNRRQRARQKLGLMVGFVEIADVAVPAMLVRLGLLPEAAEDDRAAIFSALGRLVEALTYMPDEWFRDASRHMAGEPW